MAIRPPFEGAGFGKPYGTRRQAGVFLEAEAGEVVIAPFGGAVAVFGDDVTLVGLDATVLVSPAEWLGRDSVRAGRGFAVSTSSTLWVQAWAIPLATPIHDVLKTWRRWQSPPPALIDPRGLPIARRRSIIGTLIAMGLLIEVVRRA